MTTDGAVEDAPTDSPPPSRHNWVKTLVTIIGVFVVGGLVLQALTFGVNPGAGEEHASYSADVDGVTELDVHVASGSLTIAFAPVSEATLDVRATGWRNPSDWTFEVDGDRLVVRPDGNRWFWPSFGGSRTEAELVLPLALEGALAATLDVGSGSMEVDGDLTDVSIDVSAGSLTFVGASTSLEASVSAGEATVHTSDPNSVAIDVSAGRFQGTVTGTPPVSTDVSVSAGDVILDLPDAAYAVTGGVAAGDRTVNVRTDPASDYSLHVQVSAGDATIGYSS